MNFIQFSYTTLATSLGFLSVLTVSTSALEIESTFNTDADGWTIKHFNGVSEVPNWLSSGGNPGGYIKGTDTIVGGPYFYLAPSKFLGDKSSFLGGELSFDLTVNMFNAPAATPALLDVVLIGSDSSPTLWFDLSPEPTSDWHSYSIQLDQDAGWINLSSSTSATLAQIQNVLSNLTELRIRGDWSTAVGPDTSGLDNVVLSTTNSHQKSIPEPVSVVALGIFALVTLVSYTIPR
ncbi:MAG: hypothetical protein F6K14_20050 [Symploca sp. SIO2C1]|nr:hypothetical protein [Symploca sp. SIO2C1]